MRIYTFNLRPDMHMTFSCALLDYVTIAGQFRMSRCKAIALLRFLMCSDDEVKTMKKEWEETRATIKLNNNTLFRIGFDQLASQKHPHESNDNANDSCVIIDEAERGISQQMPPDAEKLDSDDNALNTTKIHSIGLPLKKL